MKENLICWWFWFYHKKLLKKKNYKVINQADQEKEHFEPQRPQDFSDLVAHNIKENKDDDSDSENVNGLFHLQGLSRLNNFENIQEANEESGSSSSK